MIQVTHELPATVLNMETRFGRGSLNRWHILFTPLTVTGNEPNIRRGMHTDVHIINTNLRAEHGVRSIHYFSIVQIEYVPF